MFSTSDSNISEIGDPGASQTVGKLSRKMSRKLDKDADELLAEFSADV